jgi:hypothetical protein
MTKAALSQNHTARVADGGTYFDGHISDERPGTSEKSSGLKVTKVALTPSARRRHPALLFVTRTPTFAQGSSASSDARKRPRDAT